MTKVGKTLTILLGVAAGAAIAAVATKTGREISKNLSNKVTDLKDQVGRKIQKARSGRSVA